MRDFLRLQMARLKSERRLDRKTKRSAIEVRQEYQRLISFLKQIDDKIQAEDILGLQELVEERDEVLEAIIDYLKDIIIQEEVALLKDLEKPQSVLENFIDPFIKQLDYDKIPDEEKAPFIQLLTSVETSYQGIINLINETLLTAKTSFLKRKYKKKRATDRATLMLHSIENFEIRIKRKAVRQKHLDILINNVYDILVNITDKAKEHQNSAFIRRFTSFTQAFRHLARYVYTRASYAQSLISYVKLIMLDVEEQIRKQDEKIYDIKQERYQKMREGYKKSVTKEVKQAEKVIRRMKRWMFRTTRNEYKLAQKETRHYDKWKRRVAGVLLALNIATAGTQAISQPAIQQQQVQQPTVRESRYALAKLQHHEEIKQAIEEAKTQQKTEVQFGVVESKSAMKKLVREVILRIKNATESEGDDYRAEYTLKVKVSKMEYTVRYSERSIENKRNSIGIDGKVRITIKLSEEAAGTGADVYIHIEDNKLSGIYGRGFRLNLSGSFDEASKKESELLGIDSTFLTKDNDTYYFNFNWSPRTASFPNAKAKMPLINNIYKKVLENIREKLPEVKKVEQQVEVKKVEEKKEVIRKKAKKNIKGRIWCFS